MHKKGLDSFKLLQNNPGGIIRFYIMLNQLKNLYRQGWIKLQLPCPEINLPLRKIFHHASLSGLPCASKATPFRLARRKIFTQILRPFWGKAAVGGEEFIHKCESVAEHCFSMSMLADSIIKKHNLALDADKCKKMALIHELGEIIIGDFTPDDEIAKEEKMRIEGEAVRQVLRGLNWADEYYDLWAEFEAGETDEAAFMKEVDGLDFLMQGVCYGYDVSIFKYTISKIKNPILLEILEELREVSRGGETETNRDEYGIYKKLMKNE